MFFFLTNTLGSHIICFKAKMEMVLQKELNLFM